MRTDQELLEAISNSDSNALAELYDRHSQLIYGALLKLLQNTDDAENILLDVFVQVQSKASEYKPELGSPRTWLLRITHKYVTILIRLNHSLLKNIEMPISEIRAITMQQELIIA